MKRLAFEPGIRLLEAGEGDPGGGVGYASTWDTINCYGDCIKRGAFTDTIPQFKLHGFIAYGHDWSAPPIATVVDAREDDKGLLLEWQFHTTEAAQEARRICQERIDRGCTVGLSIGFDAVGYELQDPKDPWGGWDITKCELYETSIVNAPADPNARITRVNSALPAGAPLAEQAETLLADAEAVIARYAALREDRNNGRRHWSAENVQRLQRLQDRFAALSAHARELLTPTADERAVLAIALDLQRLRAGMLPAMEMTQ